MSTLRNRVARRLHALLVRSYPSEFRDEFGDQMRMDFGVQLSRRRSGRLWAGTLFDWFISMPREQWDVTRQDLRYAYRTLSRSPLFTLVVVASLALGIGANSAIYTFAHALLFQPVVPDQDGSFVGVMRGNGSGEPVSWPDYVDYRDRNQSFSQLAAVSILPVNFGRGRQSDAVMAEAVTGNYFEAIGIRTAYGRLFSSGECPAGCDSEVILSNRLWRTRFNSDPAIIGRQAPLSGIPATIIGIAPAGFDGTVMPVATDIWIHLSNQRSSNPGLFTDRRARWLGVAGRLKPGVSAAQAAANLNGIDQQLRVSYRYPDGEDRRLSVISTPGVAIPHIRRRIVMLVSLLFFLTGAVLLISCANIASLVMVRASARRQETAMRRALGANQARLVRQSLTESVLLSVLGGFAGLLLARWMTSLLPLLQPPSNDLYSYRLDIFHAGPIVWVFTAAISMVAGVVFGLLPAWSSARSGSILEIRGLDASGRPRQRLHRVLVAGQVAFSLVLLIAAGLFMRSLRETQIIHPGFPVDNGLIAPLNLNLASYSGNEEKGRRFFQTVEDRVAGLPGVLRVALTSYFPYNPGSPLTAVERPGAPPTTAALSLIDSSYIDVMNTPLLAGRTFSKQDTAASEPVALIDESLALQLWPDAHHALGETILLGRGRKRIVVAGIVRSSFGRSLTDSPQPIVFVPFAQNYASTMQLLVRTSDDPGRMIEPVRREIERLDDAVSLSRVRTFQKHMTDLMWPIRVSSRMVVCLGLLAMLLAVVGMYGVIAYSVSRRTREIGIRMALGASRTGILRLIARQGLTLAAWGILAGVPLSLAANTVLSRSLYGIRPVEPAVALAVAALWIGLAVVSSLIPSVGAMRHALASIRDQG